MPTKLIFFQVQHANLSQVLRPRHAFAWTGTHPVDLWSNERLVDSLYLAKAARANPALSIAVTQPSLRGHQHKYLQQTASGAEGNGLVITIK
jgi:hypothetical protein